MITRRNFVQNGGVFIGAIASGTLTGCCSAFSNTANHEAIDRRPVAAVRWHIRINYCYEAMSGAILGISGVALREPMHHYDVGISSNLFLSLTTKRSD